MKPLLFAALCLLSRAEAAEVSVRVKARPESNVVVFVIENKSDKRITIPDPTKRVARYELWFNHLGYEVYGAAQRAMIASGGFAPGDNMTVLPGDSYSWKVKLDELLPSGEDAKETVKDQVTRLRNTRVIELRVALKSVDGEVFESPRDKLMEVGKGGEK